MLADFCDGTLCHLVECLSTNYDIDMFHVYQSVYIKLCQLAIYKRFILYCISDITCNTMDS